MDPAPPSSTTHLGWSNVAIGFAFIVADVFLSVVLGVQVGSSLFTAAVRCVLQLSVMGLVLQSVFEAKHGLAVTAITLLLVSLGTFEVVINKSKRRFSGMTPAVFASMVVSTVPVAVLGTRFAMGISPFWIPEQFIPIFGMLCGSTISGIVVATGFVLRELQENRGNVEVYLAFGASRFEACKPIVVEALRLALLPTINSMSVIGLISIPGMMTGSILGGASVDQAAKLQMVIMFMISAASALAAITCTVITLMVTVDSEHRVRNDLIQTDKHAVWKGRDRMIKSIMGGFRNRSIRLGPGPGGDERRSLLVNAEA
ncbi:hypothetical protein BS47DRAFT_1374998 [Hydnum rufescens UP504]|uniref:Uncharacterized protein n=1 Tax=Hydnum rufescens UP504 TaxID=1448309 RepID=A0A9P6BBB3_9AGAM|nr:hypothetical protein BS47DRAFT_1374998 [Hydnum rufescens UP504]